MTLDNMTGITEGSYTGFCKSQLITCNRVKECNGVCPFEDALKHADKEMDEQNVIDHDRDWIIGCLQHDGFIHTHRFDKANQIILDALSAEAVQGWIPVSEKPKDEERTYLVQLDSGGMCSCRWTNVNPVWTELTVDWHWNIFDIPQYCKVVAWMDLEPYREDDGEE